MRRRRAAGRGGAGRSSFAGAAQLITISALTSADPLAVTWSSLLLAIAPAPLAAIAAFAPALVARPAAAAAVVVLVAGIAGGVLHTGLFFLPARHRPGHRDGHALAGAVLIP